MSIDRKHFVCGALRLEHIQCVHPAMGRFEFESQSRPKKYQVAE